MKPVATGLLEVIQPGFGTTVQDAGRTGYRHMGIPLSGWLDPSLAAAANALVGNQGDEAVLELRGMGAELRVQTGPVRVALAGAVSARWVHADGKSTALPAWQSATLPAGDRLVLGPAESGCAYLALSGGCRLPVQLGSRSSYWRAGFRGLQGRALQPGDALPCGRWTSPDPREFRARSPWQAGDGPIRVMLGPQQDHFDPAAIESFLSQAWEATAEQDRMGIRLRGLPLRHVRPGAADIVSDAVCPGAIQVPASGQPIVLLADSQTVGGYPKIATVIRADWPRLAHLRPGRRLQFRAVDRREAQHALASQQADWARWLASRETFVPAGFVDESALYRANLVSGMLLATV